MTDIDDDAAVTEFLDPLVIRAKARRGQILHGKWRLDVLLGVGGMAAVYAATHRNGSRAAVKVLHAELSASDEVLGRFMREGYAANSVGHDGVVKVLDDDVAEDGSRYLVTELLDGETLEDRRVRTGGRLGEDEVLSVADLLLDVLAAAHAKGVFHRDIKPANIFLTRSGKLRVLDFGIAHLREFSTGTMVTKAGAAMGTPAFMSPEQARGLWSEVDGRSDIWSVGATMWQAITGTFVHAGRTTNEELLSAMSRPAPPIESVLPTLSRAVARVVDRALAFEREQRWLDARRMQEAVRRAYYDRHGAEITTAPRVTVPETVPDRTVATSTPGSVRAPRPATTGRPVARSLLGGGFAVAPGRFAAKVAAGVLVAGAMAWTFAGTRHDRRVGAAPLPTSSSVAPQTNSVPRAPESITPAVATAPTALSAPAIVATDLPSAATESPAPLPVNEPAAKVITEPIRLTPPKPAPAAAATTSPAPVPRNSVEPQVPPPKTAPDCNPPYLIDLATGKKHFKVECL